MKRGPAGAALDSVLRRFGYRHTSVVRRNYNAAFRSALTRDWHDQTMSPDAELWADLRTLRGRSRALVRDNPYAAALARVWVNNTVGPKGLQVYPLNKLSSGDLNVPINTILREWWSAWGEVGVPTTDRRHDWVGVETLIARTEFVDGEFLAIEREGRDVNRFGYALQLLDADQLDETYNCPATKTRGEIRMGVEVDDEGASTFYHLFKSHPDDLNRFNRERIPVPAAQVIHYFEAGRPGQTRGVPRLSPVMTRINMLGGYEEAEVVAARVGALMSVVFEQDKDGPDIEDENDEKVVGSIPAAMAAGEGTLLPKGVTANMVKPEHPTAAFDPFLRTVQRTIGLGVGIAYHAFTGDLSQANYGSQRGGEQQQRDGFRVQHRRMGNIEKRVFANALRNSVLFGAIDLKTLDWRKYSAVHFEGRGWDWFNPKEDIETAEKAIALRLDSRTRILAERGLQLVDVLRDTRQDMDHAEEWTVPMPDPLPNGIQTASNDPPKEPIDDSASVTA